LSKQISDEIIDTLRHRADIVEIIGEHVALKKKGQNYTGLCPFHTEKTPSFVVSPGKQIFHCFGCGKGGNVFTFLMEKEGLAFYDAVEKLAARYGISLPDKAMSPSQQKRAAQIKRYHEINEWAVLFYQKCLAAPEGAPGRDYLAARGLDSATIQAFKLGYAPDQWDGLCKALRSQGVTDEEMLLLGLAQTSQRGTLIDKFRSRVMYPIQNDRGVFIGFGGRILGEGQPKYLNTQETPLFQKGHNLYALNHAKAAIRQQDQVILMEGYMDVIAAHQMGITNAVASLGTALTTEQIKCINRYTYQTIICYDADQAGENAALRGLDLLHEQGCQVRVIRIPQGKDPDDFIRQHGESAFRQLIEKAFSLYEYKFANNMEKFDKDTMAGKIAIIQAMLPDLAKEKSPVARQGYISLMSESLSFPEAAIKEELRRHLRGIQTQPNKIVRTVPTPKGFEQAEKAVMRILIQNPALLQAFEAAGGADLFHHQEAQELYLTFQALLQAGYDHLTSEDLVALTENEEQRQWLTGILLEEEIPGDDHKIFQDSLFTLQRHQIDKKIKILMEELTQLEKAGDNSGACAIMQKISGLNKEKQNLKP
jgi:DNA primase